MFIPVPQSILILYDSSFVNLRYNEKKKLRFKLRFTKSEHVQDLNFSLKVFTLVLINFNNLLHISSWVRK